MSDQGSLLQEYEPNQPYNSLPNLPPNQAIETKRVLKATIRARTAVSDLKGAGRLIPNQDMLVRSLILQEARLSSEVENIVTTNDDLYQALSREEWEDHPHIKEVMRYSEALWEGTESIRNGKVLSYNLFARIATVIKDTHMNVRSMPGTKIINPFTQEIIYTPPEGQKRILEMLDNLSEYFYNDDEIDPLVKMAVTHYQFEAIHPISDGNGRTGRVINILWLLDQKLIEQPVLYLSKNILESKADYYRGLRDVTENGDWEPWILYMLGVVEQTANDTRKRIEDIHFAFTETCEYVRKVAPSIYSKELIEIVYSQPYVKIGNVVEADLGHRSTAAKILNQLEYLKVLRSIRVGRNRLFFNERLMDILSR